MQKLIFALVILFACIGSAWAGPFGTNMGDPIDKFEGVTPNKRVKNAYDTQTMPTMHKDFFMYGLIIPPNYGLVKVLAISNFNANDIYGSTIRELFKKIKTQIENKYGKATAFFDFIQPDSIWKKGRHWLEGIKRGDRHLFAAWNLKNNKDNLSDISIEVFGTSENKSYIILSYEYENFSKYNKDVEGKGAEAF